MVEFKSIVTIFGRKDQKWHPQDTAILPFSVLSSLDLPTCRSVTHSEDPEDF